MTGLDLPGLEEQARQVLPASTYDFLAGGADDELTLCDSLAAWSRLRLWPRVLRDVAVVDTSTTVLGAPVAAPILVAPIGYQRLVRPEGEAATASGTARAGTLMVVATRSSVAIEDVARAVAPAPWWFQVYVLRDRSRTADLVARAAEAGCRALVLTGDTPVLGRRMRDERNAFLTWEPVPGAVGYNVRWGISPTKLRQTYQRFADQGSSLELRALGVGQAYWAAIESFDENGVSTLSAVVPVR